MPIHALKRKQEERHFNKVLGSQYREIKCLIFDESKLYQVGRHRFNCGHPRLWVLIIYFGSINIHYSKNIGLFMLTSISINPKFELTSVHRPATRIGLAQADKKT